MADSGISVLRRRYRALSRARDGDFEPYANMARIKRGMVDLGANLIAGIRLAHEKEVNVRLVPTSDAINKSVDLAHEIFNPVVGYSRRSLEA